MHTVTSKKNDVLFHFNSDFSGNVHMMIRKDVAQVEESADHIQVQVPGEALLDFFSVMVERNIESIIDDLTHLITRHLTR